MSDYHIKNILDNTILNSIQIEKHNINTIMENMNNIINGLDNRNRYMIHISKSKNDNFIYRFKL